MNDLIDIGDILKKWLKDNGFDGLVNLDVPCGCCVDDFAPCGDSVLDCYPAYQGAGGYSEEYACDVDFLMFATKEARDKHNAAVKATNADKT